MTTHNKKNTTSVLIASLVAALVLPFVMANAETVGEGALTKSFDETQECITGIEIKQNQTTPCMFEINYAGANATIIDTIPAEWEVTGIDSGDVDCSVEQANKGSKADKSATKIECEETDSLNLLVNMTTRESPGKGHAKNGGESAFKPTSCGDLTINDGAVALAENEFGEIVEIATTPAIMTVAIDPEDLDCDGLSNEDEVLLGTDPNVADSDSDGLLDGEEVGLGTDPLVDDTDSDTLTDGEEVNNYGTNPLASDTDGDTLSDADEINITGTDPLNSDTDGDGVDDATDAAPLDVTVQ